MSKALNILFFIIFCFKISYNQNMVFNFKTNIDLKSLKEENYMNTTMSQKLYVDFTIGNPHQIIPMTLKMNQYPTYIASSNVTSYIKIKYNESISKSFKYISNSCSENLSFLDFSKGYYVSDSVNLNSSFIFNNFTYMLATKIKSTAKNISGEIGLLKYFEDQYPYGDATKTNFIEQLINNKLIQEKIFGIVYDSEYEGRLIFGTYLHEIDNFYSEKEITSEFAVERLLDDANDNWGILFNFKCLKQPDNDEIYIEKDTYGLILYEIGLIYGSQTFRENFAIEYFKKKKCNEDLISSSPYGFYQYSCDSEEQFSDFPNLYFVNPGKYSFNFTKEELFKKIGNKYIFLIVFQITTKKIDYWRIGQIFLRKYVIFFKKGEKQSTFSYYIAKYNNKNEVSKINGQIITIIVLSIILALLIGGFIVFFCFFYEKKRKKRVQELQDDYEYDYSPQETKNGLIND